VTQTKNRFPSLHNTPPIDRSFYETFGVSENPRWPLSGLQHDRVTDETSAMSVPNCEQENSNVRDSIRPEPGNFYTFLEVNAIGRLALQKKDNLGLRATFQTPAELSLQRSRTSKCW
jgi:hypothetical protein